MGDRRKKLQNDRYEVARWRYCRTFGLDPRKTTVSRFDLIQNETALRLEAEGCFASTREEHLTQCVILLLRLLVGQKGLTWNDLEAVLVDPNETRLIKRPIVRQEPMEDRRKRDQNHFKALKALYGASVKEYTREEWEKIKNGRRNRNTGN